MTIDRARELSKKDKIVLIGGEYPYLDRHRTPLSLWTGNNMLGVKIHAIIVAQLIAAYRSYPSWLAANSRGRSHA